jgi:hypothetical protein
MRNDLDPRLRALFFEAREELDGEAFTARVMARTRFLKYRMPALVSGLALVVVACALLVMPALQDVAFLAAVGLTSSLFDLGEGWLSFVLAPVNTVGSLLIIVARLVRMGQKRIMQVAQVP